MGVCSRGGKEGGERSCVYRTLKMERGREKRGSMCKWSHYSISNPPLLFPPEKASLFWPGKKVGKVHNLLCAGRVREVVWLWIGHPIPSFENGGEAKSGGGDKSREFCVSVRSFVRFAPAV